MLTGLKSSEQNSDSDKSGGEDLVVRGQQIVDSGGEVDDVFHTVCRSANLLQLFASSYLLN